MNSLPEDSRVHVGILNGYEVIEIHYDEDVGAGHYFSVAFLMFWLIGWAFGFFFTAKELLTGDADAFLIAWLCGWTIGGGFAFIAVIKSFSSSKPEKILLNKPEMSLKTGVPKFNFSKWNNRRDSSWESIFETSSSYTISATDMKTLALRELPDGNRLTVDSSSERIDLAAGATEIEREWLYEHLRKNYL